MEFSYSFRKSMAMWKLTNTNSPKLLAITNIGVPNANKGEAEKGTHLIDVRAEGPV